MTRRQGTVRYPAYLLLRSQFDGERACDAGCSRTATERSVMIRRATIFVFHLCDACGELMEGALQRRGLPERAGRLLDHNENAKSWRPRGRPAVVGRTTPAGRS